MTTAAHTSLVCADDKPSERRHSTTGWMSASTLSSRACMRTCNPCHVLQVMDLRRFPPAARAAAFATPAALPFSQIGHRCFHKHRIHCETCNFAEEGCSATTSNP